MDSHNVTDGWRAQRLSKKRWLPWKSHISAFVYSTTDGEDESPNSKGLQGYLLPLLLTPALAAEPQPPTRSNDTEPEERWLNVRVNHMMAVNNDTFPMRFYYNRINSYGDNMVIVVGGDWAASDGWAAGGLAANIAGNIGGSLFYTEHRFYGESRLSDDTSLSHLRFLTIDQALGDLSQFINYIKSDDFEYGRYKNGKVVLVGCSFGGSLATWMRLTHPHLVQAVVSDGGPLHAREELPEYFDVVRELLGVRGGAACLQSVDQAMADIRTHSTTPAGLGQITQLFNTCTPFTASSPLDVATFWAAILDALAELVLDDIDAVPEECGLLTEPTTASPMARLANWLRSRRGPDECTRARYSELLAALSNTTYESPLVYSRLRLYRSCGQVGWLAPLEGAVPTSFYHQLCMDLFNGRLNRDVLLSGLSRTNLFFAGLSHLPDYVVTVSGTLDPFAGAGPDHIHASAKTPIYVAEGAPRCSALSSLADSPTEENRALKIQVLNDIQYFITGVGFASAARVLSSVALLGVLLAALL